MEAVVFVLVFVVLWAWIEIVRSRESFRQQMAGLVNRVWALERQLESLQKAPATAPMAAPVPAPVYQPVHEAVHSPAAQPVAEPVAHPTPPPVPPPVPVFAHAAPTPPPPPRIDTTPPRPPAPEPSVLQRLGGQDWESLIGGNLLNKAGALLLVIGIMLFLAYYGTRMGPAGRAGCSVLVSLTLLGAGVWLERRETYRVFARGLIGAGWAALYATAYAIYALPAARIIDNPFVGSFIVLLVAAGMIAHSLRYRAQGVTAVAFFSAFAALAVTPNTLLAVLCLIPLAAAVLYLAQRFNWYHMALMGVFATYGACAWRGSSNAPIAESELLFIVYWVLFEVFDLMRFSRRVGGWAVELIFPLNAAGFLGLSYASWSSKSPETIWMLSACAAALYVVSTVWRVKIELDRGTDVSLPQDLPSRVRAGSYEAPLVLSAFLTATAIVQKLTGMWMTTALALEAQALFTAGIRFRSRFLRALAAFGFLASLTYTADDARATLMVNVFGHMFHAWVFIALFHALLFYVNRAMSEARSKIGLGFSWAASFLVALALGAELPTLYIGTGCMVFAAILFEFSRAKKLQEFRQQAYLAAFFGASQSLVYIDKAPGNPWTSLAFATAFAYAAAWRVSMSEKDDAGNREWSFAGWAACAFTALSATVLLVKQVSDDNIGIALWGLALVLLELGLQRLPVRLRMFGYPVAALALLSSFARAQTNFVKFGPPQGWLSCFGAAAVAWIMSGSLTAAPPEAASPLERSVARNVLSGVGLLFAMIGFWIVVPDEFVPAAWAALGLAVLEAGNAFDVLAYRMQAHAIAIYAALAAFGFTLTDGHTHRILAIAALIAVHIGFRFLSTVRPGLEGKLPLVHEGASGILAAALIYQEVSGSLLTMAWGAEALVLLSAGFVFRERPLRLQGLGLFLICVLKLFLYDLRNLETPYRILSFIALGLILLGVSWIYTRFREQLQKLL